MKIPDNPRHHVEVAFNSVSLINETLSLTGKTIEEKINIIRANKGHLQVMMKHDWFVSSLINEEGSQIQNCIADSNSFINSNNG